MMRTSNCVIYLSIFLVGCYTVDSPHQEDPNNTDKYIEQDEHQVEDVVITNEDLHVHPSAETDTSPRSEVHASKEEIHKATSVLEGKTFELEFEDRDWLLPSKTISMQLSVFVPVFAFSIASVQENGAVIANLGTLTKKDGIQSECSETVAVDATLEDALTINFEQANLNMVVVGSQDKRRGMLFNVSIDGTFSQDGKEFIGNMSGLLGIDEIQDLFVYLPDNDAESICNFVGGATNDLTTCIPCPDTPEGQESHCVPVEAKNVSATEKAIPLPALYADDIDWGECLE